MAHFLEGWTQTVAKNQEEAASLVQKLFEVARPQAVFGEPVSVGEQVVITASEVNVAMGVGFGGGIGSSSQPDEKDLPEGENAGGGSGGGGGGASSARPVAAIVVSPQGVWVEPIVDLTKLGIALLTTLGGMWMFWSRMRRASGD
jgi:uncharacterized spore protein YtfJ